MLPSMSAGRSVVPGSWSSMRGMTVCANPVDCLCAGSIFSRSQPPGSLRANRVGASDANTEYCSPPASK